MNYWVSLLRNFYRSTKGYLETINELEAELVLQGSNLRELNTINGGLMRQVAELLAKQEVPEPVTNVTRISRADFLAEMRRAGIKPVDTGTPLDSIMTITSEVELERIAPYLVYPADLYIAEIADCEDYALEAQGDAAFKFHVSGIRMGLGYIPQGYHGFPITLSKEGNIWLLEPNAGYPYAGEWFRIGKHDYQPNKVLA